MNPEQAIQDIPPDKIPENQANQVPEINLGLNPSEQVLPYTTGGKVPLSEVKQQAMDYLGIADLSQLSDALRRFRKQSSTEFFGDEIYQPSVLDEVKQFIRSQNEVPSRRVNSSPRNAPYRPKVKRPTGEVPIIEKSVVLTREESLDLAMFESDSEITKLASFFGQVEFPELQEQMILGSKIQWSKLILFAFKRIDRQGLNEESLDIIEKALGSNRAKFLLSHFSTRKKSGNQKDEGEERDEHLPLPEVGLALTDQINKKIQEILDIEIKEDREQELKKLFEQYKKDLSEGEIAFDELVMRNYRLVLSNATRYRRTSFGVEDLTSEGMIGLSVAAAYFDYRKGFRFSTYATDWIRQSMMRALSDKSRDIRIPSQTYEDMMKALKDGKLEEASDTVKSGFAALGIGSLDRRLFSDSEGTLGDLVADPQSNSFINEAQRKELREKMSEIAVRVCSKRERVILDLRFGFIDGIEHTLEEIGKKFGVSRERIRQIEARALRKLSADKAFKQLETYLE